MFPLSLKQEHYGYISAIIAAILFGSVATVTKPVLKDENALSISSITSLIAGLSLIPFLKFSHLNSNNRIFSGSITNFIHNSIKSKDNRKNYYLLLLTCICGAVIAPSLFFFGLSYTSASDSSILTNSEVLFSILLAIIFFKERIIKREIIAIILVIVGIVILTAKIESTNSIIGLNIGNILIVGATLFWALDNNFSKIISNSIHIPQIVVLKSLIGGSILFLLTSVIFGIDEFYVQSDHIPYLVFTGVLGFGASLFFFLNSLKRIGTIKTVLLFSTSAIFGMIFAAIFLNENITIQQIIAVGVILGGCYMINR